MIDRHFEKLETRYRAHPGHSFVPAAEILKKHHARTTTVFGSWFHCFRALMHEPVFVGPKDFGSFLTRSVHGDEGFLRKKIAPRNFTRLFLFLGRGRVPVPSAISECSGASSGHEKHGWGRVPAHIRKMKSPNLGDLPSAVRLSQGGAKAQVMEHADSDAAQTVGTVCYIDLATWEFDLIERFRRAYYTLVPTGDPATVMDRCVSGRMGGKKTPWNLKCDWFVENCMEAFVTVGGFGGLGGGGGGALSTGASPSKKGKPVVSSNTMSEGTSSKLPDDAILTKLVKPEFNIVPSIWLPDIFPDAEIWIKSLSPAEREIQQKTLAVSKEKASSSSVPPLPLFLTDAAAPTTGHPFAPTTLLTCIFYLIRGQHKLLETEDLHHLEDFIGRCFNTASTGCCLPNCTRGARSSAQQTFLSTLALKFGSWERGWRVLERVDDKVGSLRFKDFRAACRQVLEHVLLMNFKVFSIQSSPKIILQVRNIPNHVLSLLFMNNLLSL